MNAPRNVAFALRRLFIPLLVACASLSSCDFFVSSWDGPTTNSPWARSVSGATANETHFNDVCTDDSGNYYAVGLFTMYSPGVCDIFGEGVSVALTTSTKQSRYMIVKYDSKGNAIWARTPSSSETSSLYSTAVDSSGNVYVCGSFSGTAAFLVSETVSVAGVSSYNALLVKYDPNGNVLWARSPTSGGGGLMLI